MYLSFYRLKHKPFQINTDPKFLWMGEKHEEALATLKYGVLDNKGFLLLTGDVGTGKTTLIHALLNSLDSETYVAFVRDPALEPLDFFQYVAYAFGMKSDTISSKGGFLIQFERFLLEAYDKRRKVVLIIDEAQRISQNLLEEVRLLSNLERQESKLLNIFFIGQNEFNDILRKPENRAIRQRITVHYNIQPLTRDEIARYINHRLEVASAGQSKDFFAPLQKSKNGALVRQSFRIPLPKSPTQIFSADAVDEVFAFSGGYPRPINIICDRAMLTSFVEGAKVVLGRHVKECVKEMEIPGNEASGDVHSRTSPHRGDNDITSAKIAEDKGPGTPVARNVGSSTAADRSMGKKSVPEGARDKQLERETGEGAILLREPVRQVEKGFAHSSAELEEKRPIIEKRSETAEARGGGKRRKSYKYFLAVVFLLLIGGAVYAEFGLGVANEWWEKIGDTISSLQETYLTADHSPGGDGARTPVVLNDQRALEAQENGDVSGSNTPALGQEQPETNLAMSEGDRVNMGIEQLRDLMKFRNIVVEFQPDSGLPDAESMEKLNALAEAIKNNPVIEIIISSSGGASASEEPESEGAALKANVVKSYLINRGVSGEGITMQKVRANTPQSDADSQGPPVEEKIEVSVAL